MGCEVVVGIESNSLPVSTVVESNSVPVSTAVECNSVDVYEPKIVGNIQKVIEGIDREKGRLESDNFALKCIKESQGKTIDSVESAMGWVVRLVGFLVTVILAGGFLVVFKNNREYKEALREAKEAAREAVRYAEKIREKLDSVDDIFAKKIKEMDDRGEVTFVKKIKEIDSMAKEELDKIKDQGKEVLDEIRKQGSEFANDAEKERKISELWSEGMRALDSKEYVEAISKFKTITEIDPNNYQAYNSWGGALCERYTLKGGNGEWLEEAISKFEKAIDINHNCYQAYSNWGGALNEKFTLKSGDEKTLLLEEAISKYKKAIEINPDYCFAYNNCASVLLNLSALRGVDKGLLGEAEHMLLEAEDIKRGSGAYNLACVMCRLEDKEGCKKWLKVAEEEGKLETREHMMKDDDLVKVRGEKWFKELKWKGEK